MGTGVAHPAPGEVWEHFKGGRYRIVDIAMGQGTGVEGQELVVYRNVYGNDLYVRLLAEWHERRVESHNAPADPRIEWRFRKVEEAPCTCHSKPPDQTGYWDPACPQHGTKSEGYMAAQRRLDNRLNEQYEQPSQDLWAAVE